MKTNGRPTARDIELTRARLAGYHDDRATFARVLVERRTASYTALQFAFREGERQRAAGVPCGCYDCTRRI